MKILNLREYYCDAKGTDISLYRNYLLEVKSDLEVAIKKTLEFLNDNDEIVKTMNEKLSCVSQIIRVIDDSKIDFIVHSLWNLSDADIKNIVHEGVNKLKELRRKKMEELHSLKKSHEKLFSEYLESLKLEGYKEEYYECADTEEFFSEPLNAVDYVLKLIETDMNVPELEEQLSSPYLSKTEAIEVANKIISLRTIKEATNIDDLKMIIKSFLTPEQIGKIIEKDDKEECIKVIIDTQNYAKTKTQFFRNLPEILQSSLCDKEVYNRIRAIYKVYRDKKQILYPENETVAKSRRRIDEYNQEIELLDKKINDIEEAFKVGYSLDMLRSFVKEFLGDIAPNNNINKLTSERDKINQEIKGMQAEVNELEKKLNQLKKNHSILEELLSGKRFEDDLDIIEAQEQISNSGRIDYSMREIEKIVTLEKRRLNQCIILITAINQLNRIKGHYDQFAKLRFGNRKTKAALLKLYDESAIYFYKMLYDNDLFVLSSGDYRRPFSFNDVFLSNLVAENIPLYQSNNEPLRFLVDYGVITPNNCLIFDNDRLKQLYELEKKLFEATLTDYGMLEFKFSTESHRLLIRLQEMLISQYEDIIDTYEANLNENFEIAHTSYSQKFVEFIRDDLGLSIENLTRQELYKTMEKIKNSMDEVEQKLIVLNDGINVCNEKTKLNNQAIAMLEGYQETRVPTEKIKELLKSKGD